MKSFNLSICLLLLSSFSLYSQTQKPPVLTELDKSKILLINNLCVAKTMYSYGINGELRADERNKYINICSQHLDYALNVFKEDVEANVTESVKKNFNEIHQAFSDLITKADESQTQEAFKIVLVKKLVDNKIDEFIKKLLCK